MVDVVPVSDEVDVELCDVVVLSVSVVVGDVVADVVAVEVNDVVGVLDAVVVPEEVAVVVAVVVDVVVAVVVTVVVGDVVGVVLGHTPQNKGHASRINSPTPPDAKQSAALNVVPQVSASRTPLHTPRMYIVVVGVVVAVVVVV